MQNDNVLTIPRDLLQDLIDDVSDYAASREFKPREKVWRDDVLARARALLATPLPEPRAEVTDDDKLCASRYRWLSRQSVATHSRDDLNCRWEVDYVLYGESFDAAIDAARTGASS